MKPSGKRKRLGRRSVGRNPQRSVSILLLEACSALLQQGSAAPARFQADSFAWLPMSQLTCLHPSSITGLRQWRPTGRSEVRAGTFESIVFHLKHSEIRERAGHSVSMGIKISNLFG